MLKSASPSTSLGYGVPLSWQVARLGPAHAIGFAHVFRSGGDLGYLMISGSVRDAEPTVQRVWEARIEEHLNQHRHREHGECERLLDDCLPLKSKQHHKGRDQCTD